jgi:tetratricopeptide (TPR) repeat protein
MDTARNLHHGVLAWRTGLVDADQFTAGCRAWAEQRERLLADLLAERGWLSAADQEALDPLLARSLERHGGDALAALKAVADAGLWRAMLATKDEGLRQWLADVLPGAAWLEEEEHKPRRGLAGATVALVVIGVLVGVVILAGLAGSTLLLWKQREHVAVLRRDAMRAAEQVQLQRQRAEENYHKARQAVDETVTLLAAKTPNPEGLTGERRRLLDSAAAHYETLLRENGPGAASRHEVALAYRQLGDVQKQLGETEKARQAYGRARDLLQELARETPETYRKGLAEVEEELQKFSPLEKP